MAEKTLAENRQARHNFFIEEVYETGMVLTGTEIKSLRAGKANMRDSFAIVKNGEVFLHNLHISPYDQGNRFNHEPTRVRKLLLHKEQINKLIGYIQQKGLTLVPLKIYLKRGMAKMTLGVAKGKKLHDKRQDMAEKDAKRDMQRAFKESYRD